jgi:heptosyltransferase-2
MDITVNNIRTICILGWGLMGDLFIRIPVIEAVKKRYPDAEITVIVDPGNIVVLENHPDVTSVFPFSRNKKPLLNYLSSSIANILKLRRKHFDLSINLYSGGSSPLIMRLINARLRLGFDHSRALKRTNNLLARHPSFCQHWVRAFADILVPLDVNPEHVRLGSTFFCSEEAERYAENFIGNAGSGLVGINLGAGAIEKCWPVERFVELAVIMHDRYGLMPLVFTNPGMEYLAEKFVEDFTGHGPALNPPVITIDKVGALMKRCDFVVTGDTSLMHLAFGLKRPTLVLFTYTRPEWHVPEDCRHVVCFKEDESALNDCGTHCGTSDLPVEYVVSRFDKLCHEST